jgi:hypothetical protein
VDNYIIKIFRLLKNVSEELIHIVHSPVVPTSDIGFLKSSPFTGVVTDEDVSKWSSISPN